MGPGWTEKIPIRINTLTENYTVAIPQTLTQFIKYKSVDFFMKSYFLFFQDKISRNIK